MQVFEINEDKKLPQDLETLRSWQVLGVPYSQTLKHLPTVRFTRSEKKEWSVLGGDVLVVSFYQAVDVGLTCST